MAINPVQIPALQQQFPDIAGQFIRGRQFKQDNDRQNRLTDLKADQFEADRQAKLQAAELQYWGNIFSLGANSSPEEQRQILQMAMTTGVKKGLPIDEEDLENYRKAMTGEIDIGQFFSEGLQGAMIGGYAPKLTPQQQADLDVDTANRKEQGKIDAQSSSIDPDFLKEERKHASSTVTKLKKRAAVIESSIGKISSLVPKIKEGSRIATGAAIMSLARLVSPGVVTEGDFRAMSGAADPVATVISILTKKGEAGKPLLEELQKAYDPTNPDLIDADGLLSIAKSLVASEVPSIILELEESNSRARSSGMRERSFKTIFGSIESINGLSKHLSDGVNSPNAGELIEIK